MTESTAIVRIGRLIKPRIYMVTKNPYGPNTDIGQEAPSGSIVHWSGNTTAGSEDAYGRQLLHWIELPGYTQGMIGAELGVDFEWDDER